MTFRSNKTLDDKHEEMMKQFEIDETETIPKLKETLNLNDKLIKMKMII